MRAKGACKYVEAEKGRKKHTIFCNSGMRDEVLRAPFLRMHAFWDVTLCRWLFTGASKKCNIFIFKGSFETSGKHPMSEYHILNSGTISSQRYQILTK
jgi:hypothetical protein